MRQYQLFDDKISIYTVTKLTKEIRFLMEDSFKDVWVEGEVSNYSLSSSGHAYFSLKDKNSVVNCVLFKGNASGIKFEMEDGLSVLCHGKISVYDKRGQYQLYVDSVEPRGKGALQLAFEQLKRKLSQEGLFNEEFKKTIPALPKSIGVVTSGTGAALQDIINVAQRRFPNINIVIIPVRVQGAEAKNDIVLAIEEFNEYNSYEGVETVDLLIVGRGGGSLEDLWSFNEETVARAIFDSEIPIVSAVGHEIDYTISDFVSDLRAPTPSAAAEMIVPLKQDLVSGIVENKERLELAVVTKLDLLNRKLAALKNSYVLKNPLNVFIQLEQRLDDILKTLTEKAEYFLELRKHVLALSAGKLRALSPLAILERGYSITFKDGDPIKDIRGHKKGQKLITRVTTGEIISIIEGVKAYEEDNL